jgi:hypothetical protein
MEGLGNQLFQFAFAHHVRLKYGIPTQLVRPFKPWRVEDRPFELEKLIQTCTHLDVSWDKRFRLTRFLERANARLSLTKLVPVPLIRMRFSEKDLPNLKSPWIRRSTFTGFFQQVDFSAVSIESVVSELNSHISEFSSICKQPYIAIHVRRGDFDLHRFGWLNFEYYQNILNEIRENLPVIIVTDSPADAESLFSDLEISQILGPNDLSAWQTLAVMAESAYLIGANSTLSFWGAVLNISKNGQAFMPEIWMRGDFRRVPVLDHFKFQTRPALWI